MEKRSLQHKAVPCGSKEGSNKAVYIVFVLFSRSVMSDFTTLWIVAHWAPLSIGILQARILAREVPCSALKGETVPDSLPATPKSPPTRRVPPRGTPRALSTISVFALTD